MIDFNNTYNYVNFTGLNKMPQEKSSTETVKEFVDRACSSLKKRGEYEISEYGDFSALVHLFDIPNSQNEAVFTIKHNRTAPKDKRTFQIGVRRLGSDREFSYILKEGTKKEILESINTADTDELTEKLIKLSESADKFYSEI